MRLSLPLILASALLAGCGNPRIDYEDPDAAVLLDENYNPTDLKQIADKMTQSLMASSVFAENPARKPVVMVERVTNRTHEHIDIQALTDKIMTGVVRSGRVEVVDETARQTLPGEYEYAASGNVDPATAKGPGHQVAPDFILRGDFADQVHETKNQKSKAIWYKVTLKLTDVSRGTVVWQDDKEIQKVRRK
jgi:uncharacterized protein (TIGR02722 family)